MTTAAEVKHKATLINKADGIYQYRTFLFAKNAETTCKEDRWVVRFEATGDTFQASTMAHAKGIIDEYIAEQEAKAVSAKAPRTKKDKKSELAAIMGHDTPAVEEVAQSVAQPAEKKEREKSEIETLANALTPMLNVHKFRNKEEYPTCRVYMSSEKFGGADAREIARKLASWAESKFGTKIVVSHYKVNQHISLVDTCWAGYAFCMAFQQVLGYIPEGADYDAKTIDLIKGYEDSL